METEEQAELTDPKAIKLEDDMLTAGGEQISTTADLRVQKIEQYQRKALADPDSLAANLGAANAELMRLGMQFEHALDKYLTKQSSTLDRLERILPATEMYLKIMRQIDRLARLTREGRNQSGRPPAKEVQ